MTVEIYLDESNIHQGADNLTVGAAWADNSTWSAWTADWLAAIKPLRIFHSVDVWNLPNSATEKDRRDRTELCIRAMKVIAKHKVEGRIGTINRQILVNSLGGEQLTKKYVDDPYFLPFIWTVNRTMQILADRRILSAEFYHEENDYIDLAKQYFEYSKKLFSYPDFRLSFKAKNESVPLQCADVFAYFGMQSFRHPEMLSKALEVADNGSMRIQALLHKPEQIKQLIQSIQQKGYL